MASQLLSILSLNVRGLRDHKKRNTLFYWVKKKQSDIIFLQETYWTDDLIHQIEREWEGECILNPGSNHSKGTAILLNKKLNYELTDIHKSDDGRILLINIKTMNKDLTLINIYAPNVPRERKVFYNKLQNWIKRHAANEQNIILGGDFNNAEIIELDRNDSCLGPADGSIAAYKALQKTCSLQDIWRVMHPNKKQFTFKEISRLDKFLLSNDLIDYVQKSNILLAGVQSDHKCITVSLNFKEGNKGPGRWKLNTSVLNDNLYKEKIKFLVKKTKEDYKSYSVQLQWEIIKIKVKEYTISYSKVKQKIKKDLLFDLERQVELKEEELIVSNYNYNVKQERDNLLNNLHTIVNEQAEGAKIRSRAKWVEEGESNTNYFFNLEKHNYTINTIRKLQREDGSYTNTDAEILDEEYKYYQKLYQDDNISQEDINTYLNDINIKGLTQNDKSVLEGEITDAECKDAVNKMKLNKSPGSDGLPVEFYQVFWNDLKDLLVNSLNSSYQMGELTSSQKRGILSLLYKKMISRS